MRTHLAKALQSRCKAIRNAVKTYNAAAAKLDPPRPPIDWKAVSHINFLEEFNLLHNTRQDIREKRWSQPAERELMKRSQRIKRAHEEIDCCHVAVRRLYTAIYDEEDKFEETLVRLKSGDPHIYGAVSEFVTRRQQVNDLLLTKLDLLTTSSDYSGDCSRGVRVGSGPPGNMGKGEAVRPTAAEGVNDGDDDDDDELDIDEADALVGQLVDYVSDLAILP